MTTTRPAPKPKPSRAGERMLAVGLASTACIGLVGVIGVRSALSQETGTSGSDTTEPVSSSGYTQADLDAYAAQLADQANQLDAYKRQLKDAARQLNTQIAAYNDALTTGQPVYVQDQSSSALSGNSGNSGNSGGQWVPAPQPQPQPQSNTKSS